MGGRPAVDELVRRACDPACTPEALNEAIGPALSSLSPKDRLGAEAVLRRLADEAIDAPTRPDLAAMIATFCGALVESGLNPTIALAPILDRLEHQITREALAFVEACRDANSHEPPGGGEGGPASENGGEEEQADPVERHGERMAALMPEQAAAFHALEPFSMAAIAMLSRSTEARAAVRSRSGLRAALDELGGQYGYAGWLWTMANVLDDEPLVVLHPGEGKGYLVRIGGLADNFQLHTLLADALVGRFSGRWLRGRRPGRIEVMAARDGPAPPSGAPPARGSFNLWTWRGLKPDGTLRDAMSGAAHWIWNEGVPADIPKFEGTRVILLGPPPYERMWNMGRRFPAMRGELSLEEVLAPDQVRGWLARIAAAVPAD